MVQTNNAGISPAAVESIAGLSAGAVSTLVVHPLDIVKTRMQRTSVRATPAARQVDEFRNKSRRFWGAI